METGYDILFFWVARMIMTGLEFTEVAPFHTVYLHGLVRDEFGHKMSKTAGNVLDPLIVMDEFGTDALRFTMLVGSTPGNDTNVGIKKVEANRNFANKIWNAGRFVINAIDSLEGDTLEVGKLGTGDQSTNLPNTNLPNTNLPTYSLADSWIWSKLQTLIRDVERQFQNFQYGQAGQQIYEFIWSDFADWYVEIAKGQMHAEREATKKQTVETLVRVFDISLRLLHPFTPFITEEVWGHLRNALLESPISSLAHDWSPVLITAKFPEPREPEGWEESKVADFTLIQELVRSIRNFRAEKNIAPSKKLAAQFSAGDKFDLINDQAQMIASLAGLDFSLLTIHQSLTEKPEDAAVLVSGSVEIYIPLAGTVDLAAEKPRLEKELKEALIHIERLEKLLSSDFANKAPAALVAKEREKLEGHKETAEKITAQLK
jgi:valyl-tRNA synthetase